MKPVRCAYVKRNDLLIFKAIWNNEPPFFNQNTVIELRMDFQDYFKLTAKNDKKPFYFTFYLESSDTAFKLNKCTIVDMSHIAAEDDNIVVVSIFSESREELEKPIFIKKKNKKELAQAILRGGNFFIL